MLRVARNRFIERWAGREWEVRQRRTEIARGLAQARANNDMDEASLMMGQTAGLINDIVPAGQLVERIAAEAEAIIRDRLAAMLA
jgi:nitronate monooxygenase